MAYDTTVVSSSAVLPGWLVGELLPASLLKAATALQQPAQLRYLFATVSRCNSLLWLLMGIKAPDMMWQRPERRLSPGFVQQICKGRRTWTNDDPHVQKPLMAPEVACQIAMDMMQIVCLNFCSLPLQAAK